MSFINKASKTNNEIIRFSTDMLSDVHKAFQGDGIAISRIIYTLVGIAGIVNIGILFNHIEH